MAQINYIICMYIKYHSLELSLRYKRLQTIGKETYNFRGINTSSDNLQSHLTILLDFNLQRASKSEEYASSHNNRCCILVFPWRSKLKIPFHTGKEHVSLVFSSNIARQKKNTL